MRKTIYIFITIFLFISSTLFAQMDSKQTFTQAESEYQVGHIDDAINTLNSHLSSYSGTLKVSAYRLMVLCLLAQDDYSNAEKYVDLLLKEDPYYSISYNDPERFAELIRNRKSGKTTLVTASQQAETLEEVPVPVTLITEDMIKAIGARDLRDVLAAYVPGITIIEGNQHNISMHGIYNITQDKILIMLNGHRLNSRCTNVEAPDFRNSLDKIKQIEVLRGPASSLYGNVALTAVVNIITKSGMDVDGAKVSYSMGNNSTYKGDLLYGKRFLNTDVLFWASMYASEGEKRTIKQTDEDFIGIIPLDGSIILEGFNHKPSYDFGLNLGWNKFKLMVNQQYSKKVIPYTPAAIHTTIYDYDRYRMYNGIKPGHGRLSTRGDLSYSDSKGNFSWNANLFFDAEEHNNYDVTGDTLTQDDSILPLFYILNQEDEYLKDSFLIQTTGVYQILEWKDITYGGSFNTNFKYKLNNNARGNILFGTQIENYKMYYNSFILGDEFDRVDITFSDRNRRIKLGNELNFSVFTQLKHYFSDRLIFNGGLRFDYKHRFNDKNLKAFSPRLSIIYAINDTWNVKAGYSRSFVDAPFFYRANKTNRYQGSEFLNPEYMNAVQLSTSAFFKDINLRFDCNLYYNKLSDLIFYKETERKYMNAGTLDLTGIENVISYDGKFMKASWNMAYQYVIKAEDYPIHGHKIEDVPSFSSNIIAMGKVLSLKDHSAWLRGNVSIYSNQTSPIYIDKGPNNLVNDPDNKTKARAILNLGGVYNWKQLGLEIQCYNVLNTHYKQGGAHFTFDVPQLGRSFLAKITYTLK